MTDPMPDVQPLIEVPNPAAAPKAGTPLTMLDALRDAYARQYGNSAYMQKASWQLIVQTYNALPIAGA